MQKLSQSLKKHVSYSYSRVHFERVAQHVHGVRWEPIYPARGFVDVCSVRLILSVPFQYMDKHMDNAGGAGGKDLIDAPCPSTLGD